MVLLPEGLKALKEVAKEVGLDLRGAYLNLDGGFDSTHNRKCIFNAGMIPAAAGADSRRRRQRGHAGLSGAAVATAVARRACCGGELVARLRTVVARAQAEAVLRENETRLTGQKEAFQAAIDGAPLEASLDILLRTVTAQAGEGVRAAFYIVDANGTCLHPVSAV
jgi:hypothetical protein